MKIILISGKAQNGKDTAAELMKSILKRYGKSVLITHYAGLLKYICTEYFGWDGHKNEAGREMLQHVGTDIIRKQNPSLWVNFVADMLTYFNEKWDYVIIPDCRFPNEISVMKDRGFDVVHMRIVRENAIDGLTEAQSSHSSETALDDVVPDVRVENNETVDALAEKIDSFIKEKLL